MTDKKIKFRKEKIFYGIVFSLIGITITLVFILYPDTFIRSQSEKPNYMQIIGILALPFFAALLFSFSRLLTRKYAIIISDDYLIDNSRYESFGIIYWEEISKLRRKGKTNVELVLREPSIKRKGLSFLKIYLIFMHNWNYKDGFLISSALLDCSIEELEKVISGAFRNAKSNN